MTAKKVLLIISLVILVISVPCFIYFGFTDSSVVADTLGMRGMEGLGIAIYLLLSFMAMITGIILLAIGLLLPGSVSNNNHNRRLPLLISQTIGGFILFIVIIYIALIVFEFINQT